MRPIGVSYLLLLSALALSSCTHAEKTSDGILVKVGAATLTRTDLANSLPVGLNTSDSAAYASAYIRRWIDGKIVSEIASSEVVLDDIDRIVTDYRNRLIEMEYRRKMADSHVSSEIPEDTLRQYYDTHKDDFIISRPMLRGVYLKVPETLPNLKLIRRLYRSDNQNDIDRLEKEIMTSAIHYDYFRDKWVDWETIELHIPYDFGQRSDDFIKGRDHFETSAGGYVYMLDISDVLPAGSYLPFENAKPQITNLITEKARRAYDANLMKELYDKSYREGKIQLFVDIDR